MAKSKQISFNDTGCPLFPRLLTKITHRKTFSTTHLPRPFGVSAFKSQKQSCTHNPFVLRKCVHGICRKRYTQAANSICQAILVSVNMSLWWSLALCCSRMYAVTKMNKNRLRKNEGNWPMWVGIGLEWLKIVQERATCVFFLQLLVFYETDFM